MRLRSANSKDKDALVNLREELWPDEFEEHMDELTRFFGGNRSHIDHIVVAESEAGEMIGFAELRIRNYAEGSEKFEVPFLEGWYVKPAYRKRGVGRSLVTKSEIWARSCGFTELASNALVSNSDSIKAHISIGFEEVERTVSFLKEIE